MTRRVAQAFRHVGFEDLGSFEAPLRAAGYAIEYVEMAECEPAALDPLAPDLLVVLGGPIGVYDHAAYPIVSAERRFLEARLRERPTDARHLPRGAAHGRSPRRARLSGDRRRRSAGRPSS